MRPLPNVGECENSVNFWFAKNWKICECPMCSDAGQTLETVALQTLYGGQFTILTQLTRLNYFDTLFIKNRQVRFQFSTEKNKLKYLSCLFSFRTLTMIRQLIKFFDIEKYMLEKKFQGDR